MHGMQWGGGEKVELQGLTPASDPGTRAAPALIQRRCPRRAVEQDGNA